MLKLILSFLFVPNNKRTSHILYHIFCIDRFLLILKEKLSSFENLFFQNILCSYFASSKGSIIDENCYANESWTILLFLFHFNFTWRERRGWQSFYADKGLFSYFNHLKESKITISKCTWFAWIKYKKVGQR